MRRKSVLYLSGLFLLPMVLAVFMIAQADTITPAIQLTVKSTIHLTVTGRHNQPPAIPVDNGQPMFRSIIVQQQ